jgi:diguanylate cyclase (GGDEF)-like protein
MRHEKSAPPGRRFSFPLLWLGTLAHLSKSSRKLAWAGLCLVPLVWLADAGVDYFIFGIRDSFHDTLLHPGPNDIWMRSMASGMFLLFGIYAALLLDHAERVERQLRSSNRELERLKLELERLVVVDPLTGVFNRRKFHETLGMCIVSAMRHQHLFALLMLDIDNFKLINDRFGHQTGDEVLRIVCGLVGSSVRSADQIFRVGGEEFCLVATAMDVEQAKTLAEKIRRVVESYSFPEVGRVTISIGIAYFREGDTQEHIFARADNAMYQAKHRGRNCVMSSE